MNGVNVFAQSMAKIIVFVTVDNVFIMSRSTAFLCLLGYFTAAHVRNFNYVVQT